MIDWHSHILPNIDDGSRSVEESRKLLEELKNQGVKTVVATPHYQADSQTVNDFLHNRETAFKEISQIVSEVEIEVVLGAEVKYYYGISRMKDLKRLRIGKSKLLLLEMPMTRWTEYTVRELEEIASLAGVTLVLAHIERYLPLQSKKVWQRLYNCGILMQVNATFFKGFISKKKALKYLANKKIHIIGSDCHNITSRPPKLDMAFGEISKKLGRNFIRKFNEFGYSLLEENIEFINY